MRLGVIGTGQMAAKMVEATTILPGIDVSAVLSRDINRARSFVAQHSPRAEPCDEIDTILKYVDALYIATPPDRHLTAIEAALPAGRAVLCEKPLTPSRAETERALALADTTGTALVEAIWPLALPSYQALKERSENLDTSIPRRLIFDFSYPLPHDAPQHLLDSDTGGVLLDRAVYGYAVAIHLFGRVRAQNVFVYRDETGLDRSAELLLEHEGARSLITLSFDHFGANRIELATKAGLAVLGTPSLGAEATWWHASVSGKANSRLGNRLDRLKRQPQLRRLKLFRDLQRWTFRSYGQSPYCPILQEFRSIVESNSSQSQLIPLRLSRAIAALVEEARSGDAGPEGM